METIDLASFNLLDIVYILKDVTNVINNFIFFNILFSKTCVDNVYFVLHSLNLKKSEMFYLYLTLT